jgi:dinuclear metal center YbgI/SA1388 family protein
VPTLAEVARELDELLRTGEIPDYPNALNGIQFGHRGPVRTIAAAVDLSVRTIEGAVEAGANLLMVHHGMFWGGLRPLTGSQYERVRLLVEHDIAVFASHLPLDAHPEIGNNVLLARELGLDVEGGFARFRTIDIGVHGFSDVPTSVLADRARAIANREGGDIRTAGLAESSVTRRWAICTGAGASSETLAEASRLGIDTLIVGEGPHHTAVEARELGIAVIYAGHYATETLGIRALAEWAGKHFAVKWHFVHEPTGL